MNQGDGFGNRCCDRLAQAEMTSLGAERQGLTRHEPDGKQCNSLGVEQAQHAQGMHGVGIDPVITIV